MLVRSYRTVSPLPPRRWRFVFLWHFPASRLGLPLAITLLCEVRTFLDSLLREHEPRPPGQLVRANTVLVGECAGQQTPQQHIYASHSGHPYRLQVRREGSAADADERLDKTRRHRRLGGDRRRRQRLRRCGVTTPADDGRGPPTAQALRQRRP